MAPFLAPILFPNETKLHALLLTFAFLPLSYLARPLGALVWGYLGDRYGRRPVLTLTLSGMALSTAAIGCLPLVPSAWIFLATCRLFQGFFSAGEQMGAALFLLENTAAKTRTWTSALFDATGILGILVASLLATLLGSTHWRLLFWIGSATALFALFIRRNSSEPYTTPNQRPSLSILWREKAKLLRIACVSGFSHANYYLLTIFFNGLLPQITSLTPQEVLAFNTHLLWIDALLLLGFGALCRWVPKERLMGFGALLAALLALPLFSQLEGASWGQAACIRLVFVFCGVALAAPYHAWKVELLSEHRFLLGGVGAALGGKFFGAPIPVLATYLVEQTGAIWTAGLPIVILGLLSSFILLRTQAVQYAEPEKELH